ncbi:MAG TPA: hypothetical protein VJV39_10565 [Dongiaceae bacterium]|nr:hypothetical protein [Dongiaceae bacterium]
MAINTLVLNVLKQVRPHLPAEPRICCLGYPDVLVSAEQAQQYLGAELAARLAYRPDSASIIAWHALEAHLDRVIDAQSLFDVMGMRLTVVDLVASRGGERIVDLNEPLPSDLVDAFDIVLDAGTMEHCFNVGQAVRNILAMAKVGGFVIHMNPMTMINHGFFNFSPTFYHDFYGQNGHQLIAPICGLSANGIKVSYQKVDHTRRQRVTDSAMVLSVVRKQNDSAPIWPMQSKYLQNPTLKNNAAG